MKKILLISLLLFGFVFVFNINSEANAKSYYKSYKSGGSLYSQKGYYRKSGIYVQPHYKTKADNSIYNNRKYILGY